MSEKELYEPMCEWLFQYISDKFKNCEVLAMDSHALRLDRALKKMGVINELANGIEIQIDVVGVAKRGSMNKLFFIEAKKDRLKLMDLGQLWAYCKLIDPDEAFLLSPMGLGNLDKILNGFRRDDLLDYGENKIIKKMKVGKWDISRKMPDFSSMVPKI